MKGDESMAVISEFNPWSLGKTAIGSNHCVHEGVRAHGGQLFDAFAKAVWSEMVMVTNVEKETQTVSYKVEDLKEDIPYFTTVIVSKTE